MAITTTQQNQLLQMTQAMFNAAPGATFLAQFSDILSAGSSIASLAQTLSGTGVFFGKSYASTLTSTQFASTFISDLVGSNASTADKVWATTYIVDKMAAGATQASIISELTQTLSSVPGTNANWGAAATAYNTTVATKIINNLVGSSVIDVTKAGAVSYITEQMAAGKNLGSMIEWAITALDSISHTDATWGSGASLFDNRVEVSKYYSVDKAGSATDLGTLQQALKAVTTDTASVASAKAIFNTALSGKAVDGYLSGATVFADLDGDGKQGANEPSAITDAKGNFVMPEGAFGKLITTGGTDISTGKAFKGVLTAPAGSTVINPLTTLQQSFIAKGQTAEQAQNTVAKALGLDATKFDLNTFDPLAVALDKNATPEQRALGAQLQAQAAKIANFLVAAGQTLTGAAGAGKLDVDTIDNAIMEALVNAINNDSDGVINFNDKAMLQAIMNESVTLSGDPDLIGVADKVAGLADNFAALSASSADSIDKAFAAGGDFTAMMVNFAQSQTVAQGDMLDKMFAAAESGNFDSFENDFLGDAFETAANQATIGDVNPDSTDDETAAAADLAAAGGGTTTSGTGTAGTGGGGGSSAPAATFIVTESAGVVEFSGTATGNISIIWTGTVGDSVATFTRQSVTATTTPDFNGTAPKMTFAAGQTLAATAANVNGVTIDGAGTVAVTALNATAAADLSLITSSTVTADSAADVTFTGKLGSAVVTVSSGSFLINAAATLGTSTFSVSSGATLNADDGKLNGVTVTGAGTTTANLTDGIDLSHVSTPVVTGIVYTTADIHTNTNLATVTSYVVETGQTLTMTAVQARDLVVTGEGGVTVLGSAGDQVLNISTTGTNTITGGTGLDQVTLGAGTDTIVINAGTGVASDSAPGYGGVTHTIDTITGFDSAADKLQLSGGTGVLADGNYNVNGTTIAVTNGIVTTTSQTDGDMLVTELLTLLDTTTNSVAFNTADGLSVLQGDGVTGGSISDIMVRLTGTSLTNLSNILSAAPADTTPPVFASAAVDGNTLVLSYTEATTLNATNTAATTDFAVLVGSTSNAVTAVAVDATAKTVTLTLTTAVTSADANTVTVAYTAPTPDAATTNSAIQDAAGNDAVTITAQAVTNNTAAPAATFTVTEDGTTHAVTFGGTATGNITIAWAGTFGSSVATFTRGGLTGTADFAATATSIALGASDTLSASATDLEGVTISGADGTVTLTDTTLAATVLTTLDTAIVGTLNAEAVTTITGTTADVKTAMDSNGITKAANVAVTLSDADTTSILATDLSAIGNLTTGTVTATNAINITGTTAEATAALVTAESLVVAATATVAVSDTTAAAADLATIDAKTTGLVTAASLTTVTGTATEVAAFTAAETDGTAIAAITNYAATVSDTDMTFAQANVIDAANGTGVITGAIDVATTVADLKNLTADGATNAYTIVIAAGDATSAAADLNTIDGITSVAVNAAAVTTVTGLVADILTFAAAETANTTIAAIVDYAVTASDTTITATDLNTIDAANGNGIITTSNGGGWTVTGLSGLTVAATGSVDTLVFGAADTGVVVNSLAVNDVLDVALDSAANLGATAVANAGSVAANGDWFFDNVTDVLTYWDTSAAAQAVTLTGVASVTTTGASELFTIATLS